MFYSVDILTRKGRLGLIWLAATYGESRRGVTLREYRKVNISRACRDIIDPVVPFALRLSSNLMVGVVRIYREQTKTVWVEATHIYRTIKNASGMRVREIDLANPVLREEAITDPLDFSTDIFRLDLEIHAVASVAPGEYFTVKGNGHPSPSPPPVGRFSPPSIPGTPVQRGSPGWLPEWRGPSGSDIDHSPHRGRTADIRIPEVDHVRTRQDEPIRIPGEVDITDDLPHPDITLPQPLSPSQRQPRPDARRRSPSPLSRSPERPISPRRRSPSPPHRAPSPRPPSPSPPHRSPPHRSPSPRPRSPSPRVRSPSPPHRSPSPRPRSPSPRVRSPSPRRLSPSPPPQEPSLPSARSPQLQSPTQPRDQQPTRAEASPLIPEADLLEGEPSLADVLMIDELTGELKKPDETFDHRDIPTSIAERDELAVPVGYATPGAPVIPAIPPPPKKKRKMPIDAMTQLRSDVIKRNVDSGGRETLCERRLDEHHLKSAKDLFMEPATEALSSFPFLELWKGNAVTSLEEYHSSDYGDSSEESPGLPTSPPGESAEVARSMDTPSEKEIPRAAAHPEGSGLFEHSGASTVDFTPDLQDSGIRPRDLSTSGDRGIKAEIDVEPAVPRGRSSSILRSSMTGLLSPIHEPSDLDDYMDEIGDLPTLMELPEVTQPIEEQAYDTWRLVTNAFKDIGDPVVFLNLCPPRTTQRKNAARVFYHLLALHKNGVLQLKQRDPYMLTNIYIYKGVNY